MSGYRRGRKQKYRSALRELVSGQPAPASPPLPLTHITESIRLEAILMERQLKPFPCSVFGDSRLYTFYARPAYRGTKEGPLHNINFAPVCFIVDASVTEQQWPIEVFPFDTGALSAGILSHHIHKDLSPFDFALDPKISSAQQLVGAFFGSERNYYIGTPSQTVKLTYPPTDAELVAYESLVRRSGRGPEDERGTSIELQFKDPLPLEGKVLAIVLPQEFLDLPDICQALKKEKIHPIPYPFIPDHSIKEFVGAFYSTVGDFYFRRKKRYGWQW